MSLLKKLASDTAVYGISNIMSRLLNYVVMTPFLTRIFAPAEFGAVTDIFVYAAFLTIAFTYRMDTAFFRYGRNVEERGAAFATAWRSVGGLSALFVAFLLIANAPIARFLQYPTHPEYVVWLALIVGFDALSSIPFARLRLENKSVQFAGIKLANVCINSFLVVLFLYILPKYANSNTFIQYIVSPANHVSCVFVANVVASGITLLLLLPALRALPSSLDATKTALLRKSMIVYALPLLLVSVAGMINEVLDRQLLKLYLPGTMPERLAQIGIYSACYKLPTLMSIFTTAFNYAAEPLFFSNADHIDARQLYARTAHIFSLVATFGCLGILLYIDVLQELLGKDFRSGLHIVPVLLLANLFFGLYNNFSIWYKLSDRTLIGTYIAFAGAAITLVLNIIFIPVYGFTASAYATLACYFFICVVTYLLGQKYFKVPYPLSQMTTYLVLGIIIFSIHRNTAHFTYGNFPLSLFWSTALLALFAGISVGVFRSAKIQA